MHGTTGMELEDLMLHEMTDTKGQLFMISLSLGT